MFKEISLCATMKINFEVDTLVMFLTLSPPEGPYGPRVFIENCEFFRG